MLAKRSPAAPESWRLARDVAFAAFALPPSGTFVVPEMPDVAELVSAAKAGNPARLLETAEAGWRGHLAWLDPHRHAADALRSLGHVAAADAVTTCMRDLVGRIPALLDASYHAMGVGMRPDGTVGKPDPVPTADDATKAWLTAKAAPGVAAPAVAAAPAPVAAFAQVAAPPPVIVRTTLAVAPAALPTREPPDAPDLEAFDAAMAQAKLPEALAAFSRVARSTRSPRARAWMAVHASRALLTANRPDLALPILLSVDDDARAHALDAWEPDLAAEILGNILDAARVEGSGVGDSRLEDTRARLVRLGDLRALTDER